MENERIRHADRRVLSRSYQPVALPDGGGNLWLYRDVTDIVDREEELQRQNERLDEFVSVISHDLQNPLSIADGHLQLATDDETNPHLDTAQEAIRRSQRLVTELLELARQGDDIGQVSPIDVAGVAEACWQATGAGDGTLSVNIGRKVLADPTRFRQLLQNLFENAVKDGGDDVTVTVGPLEDGFYIADDGEVLSDEASTRLFEPGYSGTSDSTGFGLSIVDRIVDAHG